MTTSMNKKIIVPAVLGIAAALIGMVVLSPTSAIAQQLTTPTPSTGANPSTTTTTAATTAMQRPNITGSINIPQIIKSNIKVNFSQAADTAAKQVSGGMVVSGHIGVVQGYLVYKFIVIDSTGHTVYCVIIDPGNGQVLYKSAGQPLMFHHHHMGFAKLHGMMMAGTMAQNQTGTATNSTTTMASPSSPMM